MGAIGFLILFSKCPISYASSNIIPKILSNNDQSHDPIFISGNDWTSCDVVTGTGTRADPYIIADLIINAGEMDGIYIENSDVYGIIKNCTVYSNNHGIILNSTSNCKMIDNYIYQNSKGGFKLIDSPWCTLINNYAEMSNWSGICLNRSSNCLITQNTLKNNSMYGIRLELSNHSVLTDNNVNNSLYGYCLYQLTNCTLTKNTANFAGDTKLYGNGLYFGDGFSLFNVQNCTLSHNTAKNSSRYGIFLDDASYHNLITANWLIDNVKGPIQNEGLDNLIKNNHISPNATISGYTGEYFLLILSSTYIILRKHKKIRNVFSSMDYF